MKKFVFGVLVALLAALPVQASNFVNVRTRVVSVAVHQPVFPATVVHVPSRVVVQNVAVDHCGQAVVVNDHCNHAAAVVDHCGQAVVNVQRVVNVQHVQQQRVQKVRVRQVRVREVQHVRQVQVRQVQVQKTVVRQRVVHH